MRRAATPWFGCCLLLLLSACASTGPGPSDEVADDSVAPDTSAFQAPIDLVPQALGPLHWEITTSSDEAQAYFDQGLQLRYAYNVGEAARSFREARLADPGCAMCWWGEAFALGAFLNGRMRPDRAPYAHTAIEKAVELVDSAAEASVTELERDLILAARVRYPEDYDSEKREDDNRAFADAMARVYEKHPDHSEVGVVYAVALFLLEERRGYRDLEDPDLIRLHGVLTGVLEASPKHPGACHLYVHATESSQEPGLALDCIEHLGPAIPWASHIQHMPSHTWNEVGSWGRSVRANQLAVLADQKAAENEGFSYAPSHNLHMLLFAASYDGQGAVATQAGRDYTKLTGNSMYEVLTLLRFGRFAEILANDDRPSYPVGAAMWDVTRGLALVHEGELDRARELRDESLSFAETTEEQFRFHPAGQVVGTVAHILDGEILRAAGNLEAAIASFEKAAQVEDSMDYDEPEPLPFAARHWLGAALLEADRAAEAEEAYRTELTDHPHDVWALTGLLQAFDAQGKTDPEVVADHETSTARVDAWISSSRF